MVPYAATISFKVTGLVPRASEGTRSSLLCRTPIDCISCAVIVFFECTSPSRRLMGRPLGGEPSVGVQTSLPDPYEIGSSMKVYEGSNPCTNAAPYTKGLKVEPGCRLDCAT